MASKWTMNDTGVKDAPVVAAPRKVRVDYLVSLDRAYLDGVSKVLQRSNLINPLTRDLMKEMRTREE